MAARLAAYMPTADLRTRAIQQVHTALVKSADTTAKLGPQNLLIARQNPEKKTCKAP